MTKAAYKPHT